MHPLLTLLPADRAPSGTSSLPATTAWPDGHRDDSRLASRGAPACAALAALLLLASAAPARAQGLAGADMSGTWKFKETVTFLPNDFGAKKGKATSLVHLRESVSGLHGLAFDKLGKCGLYEAPYDGARSGAAFMLHASNAVIDLTDCSIVGSVESDITGVLTDGVHAVAGGTGVSDFWFPLDFTLTGSLVRVSGMQTADDPDGPDGPAVPLALMGSGAPGSEGCHDLALTALSVAKTIAIAAGKPAAIGHIKLTLQNRGQHAELIPDSELLAHLVDVTLLPAPGIAGQPAPPNATLHALPASAFPILLPPRKSLKLVFDVRFDTALDPLASSKAQSHADWMVQAHVRHAALPGGIEDDHPADDVAPRGVVAPYTFDAYPDGKIKERGVGSKKADKTFGDPVLVDLVQKG